MDTTWYKKLIFISLACGLVFSYLFTYYSVEELRNEVKEGDFICAMDANQNILYDVYSGKPACYPLKEVVHNNSLVIGQIVSALNQRASQ